MAYTLGEAAKAASKSKTSIKRALEKGRISGQKNEIGEWQIEPVELHRVYPPVELSNVTGDTPQLTLDDRKLQVKLEAVEQENALLRELVDREREIGRSFEQDRDHWRQQATALLTDQRSREGGFLLQRIWKAFIGKR